MNRREALRQLGHATLGATALALCPACGKSANDAAATTPAATPSVPAPPPQPAPAPPAAAAPPAALVIDLTHDVICPWCRIGHHNLRSALATWQGAPVTVNLHPYLLDPTVPPEGVDLRKRLAERYGGGQVEQMFARVTQVGADFGTQFNFAKIQRTPDTTIAHAVILAAPTAQQSNLLDVIQRVYFEDGADIGAQDVLLRCWRDTGLPVADFAVAFAEPTGREAVRQLADAATRKGLHGVPHFALQGPGGKAELQGGQAPAAITAALQRVA